MSLSQQGKVMTEDFSGRKGFLLVILSSREMTVVIVKLKIEANKKKIVSDVQKDQALKWQRICIVEFTIKLNKFP